MTTWQHSWVAFVCVLSASGILTPVPPSASSTPLNQWPMVMTHDSATSYYASSTCGLTKLVQDYVMTQAPGTFSQQLDCGARAFDLRPYQDGTKLLLHHGDVVINHAVSDVLTDVATWASQHPDEFVLIYGSHCSGGNECPQMFSDALKSAKIPVVECSDIAALTLGTAQERGKLPGGGSVLATWGCVEENYDPSITCYGKLTNTKVIEMKHAIADTPQGGGQVGAELPEISWSCYGADANKSFDPFWAYITNNADGHGRNQPNLWMTQAHWQYDASSVVQGEFLHSCILLDESKAGVNQKLAQRIRRGEFPHINLLEVDNVCDGHGPELLNALRSRFVDNVSKTIGDIFLV